MHRAIPCQQYCFLCIKSYQIIDLWKFPYPSRKEKKKKTFDWSNLLSLCSAGEILESSSNSWFIPLSVTWADQITPKVRTKKNFVSLKWLKNQVCESWVSIFSKSAFTAYHCNWECQQSHQQRGTMSDKLWIKKYKRNGSVPLKGHLRGVNIFSVSCLPTFQLEGVVKDVSWLLLPTSKVVPQTLIDSIYIALVFILRCCRVITSPNLKHLKDLNRTFVTFFDSVKV